MVNLLNQKVKHFGNLGVGTVIEQDDKHLTVEFSSKTMKFQYPASFEKFLIAEDENVANAIAAELKAIKDAEEAAKAEAAAKKAAEEQAKIEALKAQAASSGKKASASKAYQPVQRVDGQALTYFVFQKTTNNEEKAGQFIWAPKFTKDGGTAHHWDKLMDVRAGDVIFHSSGGYIKAISRAKAECKDSARPATGDWSNWEKDGRRVDCEYHVLKNPLKHGNYKEKILEYCNVKYAPFDKDGNGNMGYLFDLDQNLAAFFIQEIAKQNPEVKDLDFLQFLLKK